MVDNPSIDTDSEKTEATNLLGPTNAVVAETTPDTINDVLTKSPAENSKPSKGSKMVLIIFIVTLFVAVILALLLVYTTSKSAKNVSSENDPGANNLSVQTKTPETNYILAYTRNTSSNEADLDSLKVSFYDISNKTEVKPSGNYQCQDEHCSIQLYDWSPNGNIMPFKVSEYDQAVDRIMYYDKAKNAVAPITTLDKQSGIYGIDLIFEKIIWNSDTQFQVGSLSFDLATGEVAEAVPTRPEASENDTKKTHLFSDGVNKNIIYELTIEDTGAEKFQGFFGPSTIYNYNYGVIIDGHSFLQTAEAWKGLWNNHILTFKPTKFNDMFEALEEMETIDWQIPSDPAELDADDLLGKYLGPLGPLSDAKITLHSVKSNQQNQEIILANDNVWINYDIQPRQNTNKVVVFQSEYIQIPEGKTRISEIDTQNPSQIRVIKELDISGMEFNMHPIGHNNMTSDGKYLLVARSLLHSGEQGTSNKLEILDLDTGKSEVICESQCVEAKLHSAYKFYPLQGDD